jgi:hypothetical protein
VGDQSVSKGYWTITAWYLAFADPKSLNEPRVLATINTDNQRGIHMAVNGDFDTVMALRDLAGYITRAAEQAGGTNMVTHQQGGTPR